MENDSMPRRSSAVAAHSLVPEASAPESGRFPRIDELWARPEVDAGFDVYAGCAHACGTIPPGRMFLP